MSKKIAEVLRVSSEEEVKDLVIWGVYSPLPKVDHLEVLSQTLRVLVRRL
jgi:hypothetical protein